MRFKVIFFRIFAVFLLISNSALVTASINDGINTMLASYDVKKEDFNEMIKLKSELDSLKKSIREGEQPKGEQPKGEQSIDAIDKLIDLNQRILLIQEHILDSRGTSTTPKKLADTNDDYYQKFIKSKGAKITTSGVAYRIQKRGKGDVLYEGKIVSLSVNESRINGKIVSKPQKINVRYTKSLPEFIYEPLLGGEIGMQVRVVQVASKTYVNQKIPEGISPSDYLVYDISVYDEE